MQQQTERRSAYGPQIDNAVMCSGVLLKVGWLRFLVSVIWVVTTGRMHSDRP